MPDTVPVQVEMRVADLPAVKAVLDAVADLISDPFEVALHGHCTHVQCTYRQLRESARGLAQFARGVTGD